MRFYWGAPQGSDIDRELDTRPEDAVVCFYNFDNYLLGSYRCVHIVIPKCAGVISATPLRVTSFGRVVANVNIADCDNAGLPRLDCNIMLEVFEDNVKVPYNQWQCLPRVRAHLLMLDVSEGLMPTPAPTPAIVAAKRRLQQAGASGTVGSELISELREAAKAYINWVYDEDCEENRIFGVVAYTGYGSYKVVKAFDSNRDFESRQMVLNAVDTGFTASALATMTQRTRDLYGAIEYGVGMLNSLALSQVPETTSSRWLLAFPLPPLPGPFVPSLPVFPGGSRVPPLDCGKLSDPSYRSLLALSPDTGYHLSRILP